VTVRVEKFGDLFVFLPKSGLKASDGQQDGAFPFFTSSSDQSRWTDAPVYSDEALVFATGGAAAVHHVTGPFAASADCLVASPSPSSLIDARYAYRYLTYNINAIEAGFRGAGLRHVSKSFIQGLNIPVPRLSEQRRIVEILDKADALRAKRHDALARLDTLTQSIFVDMFGDPVRNDKNWPLATVASLCALVRGSSPRPQGDPMFFGGPVPRLMVADITRDGWSVTPRIDSLTIEGAKRSRPVPAGTIVMAVSGNVGLVSQLAVDACVHDGFVAFMNLDVNRCQPGFLLALLHYSKAAHERHKAGAIFINLTTTDIKAMRLPLPPIALQREFYGRMMSFDTLKTAQLAAQTKLEMLFASLQLRAFSGDLVSAGPGQLTV
jgi:hypothetical protein